MMMILSHVWVNTSQYSVPLLDNHATQNVSQLPRGYPLRVFLGSNTVAVPTQNSKERVKPVNEAIIGNNSDECLKTNSVKATRDDLSRRKVWIRISDEVFIYSAHLDLRNFSSSNSALQPPLPNNLSATAVGTTRGNALLTQSQVIDKSIKSNGGGDDSDKLSPVMLVRIVGIKTVPPLREFIKGDVLDWFRIKHEMEFSHKYECKLFFTSSGGHKFKSKLHSLLATKVTYTIIEEGIKVYAGCYVNCYFQAKSESVLELIRMSARADNLQVAMYPRNVSDYPTKLIDVNTLMIEHQENQEIFDLDSNTVHFYEKSLAICVRPLFGPFDDLGKLIQFISYYHMMGITQFNFYSLSISPQVRKYLMGLNARRESRIGGTLPRFIIHDWNLPTGNTSELWDYGTLAALNDCLLSNINQHFVIFVDIDEFIVPQQNRVTHAQNGDGYETKNPSLWEIIDAYNRTGTFQYLVRNTFFCKEFCNKAQPKGTKKLTPPSDKELPPEIIHFPENSTSESLKLPIFECTIRTKRIWHPALRTKFIVNPRQVLAVGHHLVTKYINKKTDFRFTPGYSVQVNPNVAIMYHYRECASISSKKHPVLDRIREEDRTMLRFQGKVLDHMHKYYLPEHLDGL